MDGRAIHEQEEFAHPLGRIKRRVDRPCDDGVVGPGLRNQSGVADTGEDGAAGHNADSGHGAVPHQTLRYLSCERVVLQIAGNLSGSLDGREELLLQQLATLLFAALYARRYKRCE